MALLHLEFRKVAQMNIDHFDRLGGFHGEDECLYHYENGMGCAIGICDTEGIIGVDGNHCPVDDYHVCLKFECDNQGMIRLIQSVHDYIVNSRRAAISPLAKRLSDVFIAVPEYIADLVSKVHCGADLTPDLYKEMMRRIAAQP